MNSQQIKEILLSEIHEVSINYEKGGGSYGTGKRAGSILSR